jgi:hypothetical protein
LANIPVIASALNDRGVRTARGGAWHDSTVRNLLERAAPSVLKKCVAKTDVAMPGVFQSRQAVQEMECPRHLLLRFFGRRCTIEFCAAQPAKLGVRTRLNRAIAGRRKGLQRLDIRRLAVQLD